MAPTSPPPAEPIELVAGSARAVLDPAHGGRVASLTVAGHELLVGPGDGPGAVAAEPDPIAWGLYPMAPWAGRIRHGRFTAGGVEHRLPVTLPPHAIHGTAYTSSAWRAIGAPTADAADIGIELGHPWPWPAYLEHRARLTPDRLRLELILTAGEHEPAAVTGAGAMPAVSGAGAMPAVLGWHPWFRRLVGGAGAELRFEAGSMFELDADGIPTGRLVAPSPPPWDDCFTDVGGPPGISWPGVIELELASSCGCWVVYNRPEHALCVEPQTDAPDAANRHPRCELRPGEALSAWFEIRWRESTS